LVYQTIVDLHNAGRVATRSVVKDLTGLNYGVVDDHVKRMLEDGRLRRVVAGVFEPVEEMPSARAVSLTRLPNGMAKIEIGDHVIDVVPSEERQLASMLAGRAVEMSGLQNARELTDNVTELRRLLTAAMEREKARDEAIRVLQGVPLQEEIAFT
jgi:hypothetical protein